MAQDQLSPTYKDFLTVRQCGLAREPVVKISLTAAVTWLARDLEQTIAANVAEIIEA